MNIEHCYCPNSSLACSFIARAISLIVPHPNAVDTLREPSQARFTLTEFPIKKALVVTQGQVKHLIISDERKFAT
ncbi:hypothetical protein N9414_01989 [Nodularia spumigena CCY9414]|jgi:hypothetical protein|nr:hypothetical protein N9414_01989 [Nodularia spumigena CCY9414]